jgi:ribosomal 30S subunit maturation factor RimM
MIETGSNDVLVIKGDNEILIPYIFGESVKNVIIEENKIIIDKIYCEY